MNLSSPAQWLSRSVVKITMNKFSNQYKQQVETVQTVDILLSIKNIYNLNIRRLTVEQIMVDCSSQYADLNPDDRIFYLKE